MKNDRKFGDYCNEKNNEKIIEAGNILWNIGKIDYMKDGLIWSFIPKRYWREIDYMWDEIGDWRV